MKKVLGILAILSLLMVPCVSMAATMSDADLAAVTGQSGVTIDISSLQIALGLGTFTYGDLDGFTTAGSLGTDFTAPGYLNVAFFPLPMHIGIGDIEAVIDIGTSVTTSVTAVNIGVTIGSPITLDAMICNVDLAPENGAAVDYAANTAVGSSYGPSFSPAYYTASNAALSYNIGVVGISLVSVTIPSLNIQISAH
jgi:hypothetical protein